jgi:hypothetical protein
VVLHDVESVVDGKSMVRRGEVELSGSGKIKGGEILGEGSEEGRNGASANWGVCGLYGPAGWVGGRKEQCISTVSEGGLSCAKRTDLCKVRGKPELHYSARNSAQ